MTLRTAASLSAMMEVDEPEALHECWKCGNGFRTPGEMKERPSSYLEAVAGGFVPRCAQSEWCH